MNTPAGNWYEYISSGFNKLIFYQLTYYLKIHLSCDILNKWKSEWVSEGERERVCVCVWERERESVCVCVRERERECVWDCGATSWNRKPISSSLTSVTLKGFHVFWSKNIWPTGIWSTRTLLKESCRPNEVVITVSTGHFVGQMSVGQMVLTESRGTCKMSQWERERGKREREKERRKKVLKWK